MTDDGLVVVVGLVAVGCADVDEGLVEEVEAAGVDVDDAVLVLVREVDVGVEVL